GETQIDGDAARLFFLQPIRVGTRQREHERALPVIDVAGGPDDDGFHRLTTTLAELAEPAELILLCVLCGFCVTCAIESGDCGGVIAGVCVSRARGGRGAGCAASRLSGSPGCGGRRVRRRGPVRGSRRARDRSVAAPC